MSNNRIMAIIVVVLLIVVGYLIYQNGQKNATFGDKVGGTINEATEEIKDEIDDHTTGQ